MRRGVHTDPVLFSVLPATIIISAVGPIEFSFSLFFIINILTLIFSTVGPDVESNAVYLVLKPFAVVAAAILPHVAAAAMLVVGDVPPGRGPTMAVWGQIWRSV